jgi:hypothetical protein
MDLSEMQPRRYGGENSAALSEKVNELNSLLRAITDRE